MDAIDKHRQALEVHETMMGQGRGRLAVAMDLLTDALAMIGQHSVYCQSTRVPGRPTLDIAFVIERHGRPVAQLVPVRRRRASALGAKSP